MGAKLKEGIAKWLYNYRVNGSPSKIGWDNLLEKRKEYYRRDAGQIISLLKDKMKRTIIGEERSVPDGTEIYFLFKDELE